MFEATKEKADSDFRQNDNPFGWCFYGQTMLHPKAKLCCTHGAGFVGIRFDHHQPTGNTHLLYSP